jgi:hypothetical protein
LLNGRPLGNRIIQAKEEIFYNARENIFNKRLKYLSAKYTKNLVIKQKKFQASSSLLRMDKVRRIKLKATYWKSLHRNIGDQNVP